MIFYPSFIFFYIWIFITYLYFLEISPIFTFKAEPFFIFCFFLYLPFLINFYLFSKFHSKIRSSSRYSKEISFRYFKTLFGLFLFLTLVEFFISGNFPLIAALGIGKNVLYTEYGIKGFHGFVNSIHLCLIIICFSNVKKYLFPLVVLLILLFLLLSRQVFISLFVLLLSSYIYNKGFIISFRSILYLLIISILPVSYFIIFGNVRSGSGFIYSILEIKGEYPDFLEPLFWLYIYIVSPVFNLINNLFLIESTVPLNTLINILPSPIKALFAELMMADLYLEHPIFNVSTIFPSFIGDFGYFGISFVSLIFIISDWIIVKCKNNLKYPLFLFFCHGALLSFFGNFLISLPFLSFLLLLLFVTRSKSI